MATPTTSATATPTATTGYPLRDDLRLLSFNVGHGDCTLLEYHREGTIAFRCLVDAGQSLPLALLDHLRSHPRAAGLPDIDVLVLSHVDADHQGGLPTLLAEGVSIGEYLGPCLPTFRRLKWLFAPRIQAAVDKAIAFETDLLARKIPVSYPLEGFKSTHATGRVTISVISPAAKLLQSLSTANDAELSSLLMRQPLPLQWLLEPGEDGGEQDDNQQLRDVFRGRVSLSPGDFDGVFVQRPSLDPGDLHAASATLRPDFEPEFFGNAILNDTSLVLVVDVHLDAMHRRRVVLTGDQENWTYIAAQHPGGLGVDVLKAPHHGGRVYLNDRNEAIDSLYLWLRPRTVMVSANGRHNLPRDSFRDSMRKIGATLLCPNVRGIEPLSAGMAARPGEKSCFAAMACTSPAGGVTTLTLTGNGDSSDAYACVQGAGHSGTAPIVVLRQDIIPTSESLVRYTRRELERHATWIQDELVRRHKASRARTEGTPDSFAVRAQTASADWNSIAVQAKAAGRHDLVADPAPVLSFARSHRLFWVNTQNGEHLLHRLPSASEIADVVRWLKGVPRLLLHGTFQAKILATREPVDILRVPKWDVVDSLIAGRLSAPSELVADEVRPLLLQIIAENFTLRVCSADNPYTHEWASDLYLLLERKVGASDPPLPTLNLSGSTWSEIWAWRESGAKAPWDELRAFAETDILLGNYFDRYKYRSSSWMEAFENYQHRASDPFTPRFLRAEWTPFW